MLDHIDSNFHKLKFKEISKVNAALCKTQEKEFFDLIFLRMIDYLKKSKISDSAFFVSQILKLQNLEKEKLEIISGVLISKSDKISELNMRDLAAVLRFTSQADITTSNKYFLLRKLVKSIPNKLSARDEISLGSIYFSLSSIEAELPFELLQTIETHFTKFVVTNPYLGMNEKLVSYILHLFIKNGHFFPKDNFFSEILAKRFFQILPKASLLTLHNLMYYSQKFEEASLEILSLSARYTLMKINDTEILLENWYMISISVVVNRKYFKDVEELQNLTYKLIEFLLDRYGNFDHEENQLFLKENNKNNLEFKHVLVGIQLCLIPEPDEALKTKAKKLINYLKFKRIAKKSSLDLIKMMDLIKSRAHLDSLANLEVEMDVFQMFGESCHNLFFKKDSLEITSTTEEDIVLICLLRLEVIFIFLKSRNKDQEDLIELKRDISLARMQKEQDKDTSILKKALIDSEVVEKIKKHLVFLKELNKNEIDN